MRAREFHPVAALLAFASTPPPLAQTIEEKAQVCAACHGENGVPPAAILPVPVIWGQNLGYLFFQLRDFKSGRAQERRDVADRRSAAREDLMPLAQYFSKKPWPNLQQPRPSADVAGARATRQQFGRLHQLPSGGLQGRGHAAAACRPGPRLSGKDDDSNSERRPRQQSRHDRSDEVAHPARHLGARRLALRRCETMSLPRSGGGGSPAGRWRGLACSGRSALLLPARFARHLPHAGRNRTSFSLKLARTSSFAARSSAVLPSLSLSVRSAPRWRRSATVGASPSAAAIISAVRPRLSAASSVGAAREQKIDDALDRRRRRHLRRGRRPTSAA